MLTLGLHAYLGNERGCKDGRVLQFNPNRHVKNHILRRLIYAKRALNRLRRVRAITAGSAMLRASFDRVPCQPITY